jgi:hypothetical protein
MKRVAVALAAIAVLVGVVLPATSQAAPPGFITILFGRTQFVSSNGSSCQPLPNTVDLNQVASDMAARGLTGVGNVIVNRTQETGLFCARDGLSLHPGWDWLSQRQAQGWRFISASLDYPNMTTLAYPEQVRQSCGSLEAFTSHSIVGAQGMFAFPNDKSTAAIQTDPVSTCFDFGRKYGPGLNTQSQMAAPWFASTLSVGGGKCNDSTLPCYTGSAPLRYYSPESMAAQMNVAPGSWFNIQFYRFVTGSFSSTHSSWDCTSPDWRQHWVSRNELYCYSDFLQVMDAAQAAVASGVVVTDPHSVALAWGRGASPTPSPSPSPSPAPPRPDGSIALGTGTFVGDDVYNASGAGQTISQVPIAKNGSVTFSWRIQNDGNTTDVITLRGQGTSPGFSVKFTAGTTDITGVVVTGTYARSIAPGATITITLRVNTLPAAALGAVKREFMTATSQDGVTLDAVIAAVVVR